MGEGDMVEGIVSCDGPLCAEDEGNMVEGIMSRARVELGLTGSCDGS